MKKTIVYLMLTGMLCSCGINKEYVITGTAPAEMNGSYVKMLRNGNFRYGERNSNTDSALVENGAFTFKGRIDGDSLRFISGRKSSLSFILEPGTLTLDLVEGKNLGGTAQNDALIEYRAAKETMTVKFNKHHMDLHNDTSLDAKTKEARQAQVSEKFRQEADALAIPLIQRFKNNSLAEYVLWDMLIGARGVDEYDRLYALVDNRPVGYGPLKGVISDFEAIRRTSPGAMFADFVVENGYLDGTDARLSDYVGKGKYVLIDFWASWCGWCRAEFPVIAEVYEKHSGDNFEIVGIVVNDKLENTKKALSEEPLAVWPQIVNAGSDVMHLYGVSGIPEIILFAPDGKILARGLRGENLKETVDKYLIK